MSAETIARWNAIPMERPYDSITTSGLSSKRPRDDTQDSDDDISLISRTPSPPPSNAMDIDKYDEYHRGTEREVITVETKIKPTNKGFAMLSKLGWVEGQPLGLSGDGRVDPIPFYVKHDLTGLGKSSQDVRVIESTVSQRRGLDSERQTKETEDQRRAREDAVAKKAAVQTEISTTLRAFYCELCDKQFQNVAQYDEHTNSYAHHHKARFRDMQLASRAASGSKEEIDKRKEKERKREEKELRKLAKAAGIKMAKPPATLNPVVTPAPGPSVAEAETKPSGFKGSGWATVGSTSSTLAPPPSEPPTTGFRRAGWGTVGSTPSAPTGSGGWSTISNQPPPPQPVSSSSNSNAQHSSVPAPAFRTGGWATLDTGSSQPTLPDPSDVRMSSPPPAPRQGGWAPVQPTPSQPVPSKWSSPSTPSNWSSISGQAASTSTATLQPPQPQLQPQPQSQPSTRLSKEEATARQESSRSGWQQFRGRRR